MLEAKYIEHFKRDYYRCGKYNLDVQVFHLARLADHYKQRYLKSGEWTDCLRSHALYNSCGVRRPDSLGWKERIFEVQQLYWKGDSTLDSDSQDKISDRLKAKLEGIRIDSRNELDKTMRMALQFKMNPENSVNEGPQSELTKAVKQVSIACTDGMLSLAKDVMYESMNALSESPPCSFTVVAIGSLARGEATPYSDLEYMFLVERRTSETVKYFQKLAMTSYFLIGNLQETKLSYMAIDELERWFDDRAKNGFKIDGLAPGAGNIPTGNGSHTSENHFIITPEELAKRYQDVLYNPIEKEALRGDFTAMVAYMKQIFAYNHESDPNGDLLKNARSLIAGIAVPQQRKDVNQRMLEADIRKFNFVPSNTLRDKGFTIDVKKEIYRFPSILLYDLSIVLGIRSESAWETLHALLDNGSLTLATHACLSFLLASACFIRMSAYLFHDSHDDRISVAEAASPISTSEASKDKAPHRRWFVPMNLFASICYAMIPLKNRLQSMGSTGLTELNIDGKNLQDGRFNQIQTLHYCGRHADARRSFIAVFGPNIIENPGKVACVIKNTMNEPTEVFKTIADTLIECSEFKAALYYSLQIDQGSEDQLQLHQSVRLAVCYRGLSQYYDALAVLGKMNDQSSIIHQILGELYSDLRNFKVAEHHLLVALDHHYRDGFTEPQYDYFGQVIEKSTVHDQISLTDSSPLQRLDALKGPTVQILSVIGDLGFLYYQQGQLQLSRAYFEKYKELISSVYGSRVLTTASAYVLNRLGNVTQALGQHEEAQEFFMAAINTYHQIYGQGAIHADIAHVIHNSSTVYTQRDPTKCLELSTQAINIYQQVYQVKNHFSIARTLASIVFCHQYTHKWKMAITSAQRALAMFKAVLGESSKHEYIALTLVQMGQSCIRLKEYEDAESYLSEALHTCRGRQGDQYDNPSEAQVLAWRAINYNAMGEKDKSREQIRKAETIYQQIGENKLSYADEMNRLGVIYNNSAMYRQAELCYEKALAVYMESGTKDIIATILHNQGGNYMCMNENQKAIQCEERAMSINREIYGERVSNRRLSMILYNLGASYHNLAQYATSKEYLLESLSVYKEFHGAEAENVSIARVLVLLSITHFFLDEPRQARLVCQEALDMYLAVDPQHPKVPEMRNLLRQFSSGQ